MLTSLAVVILLTARLAHAGDPSNWRVVQIPGTTDVRAQGINDIGQVAGTYKLADNSEHGFIRNTDGSITTIDVIPSSGTHVLGINHSGQTAGYSGNIGFIRNADGTVITINYSTSSETDLSGINDLGEVLGTADPGGRFIRKTDGTFVKILATEPSCLPLGLNNSDQIAGWCSDRNSVLHGLLLNSDGSMTMFDAPDALFTIATGINNLGQIVGYYGFKPASSSRLVQNRGFIRDIDGTITTFDAPYLGSTQPNGIADTGMIAASFSRNPENEAPNIGLVRKCLLCP